MFVCVNSYVVIAFYSLFYLCIEIFIEKQCEFKFYVCGLKTVILAVGSVDLLS